MKQIIDCYVLAGGFGTRLKHKYPDTPKALIKINGKPFLDYVTSHINKYLNVHYKLLLHYRSEDFLLYVKSSNISNKFTILVEDQPKGTGGAFVEALKNTNVEEGQYCMLINADTYVDIDLASVMNEFTDSECMGCLIGTEVENVSRFGCIEVNSAGHLVRYIEKKARGKGIISTGIYIFKSTKIKTAVQDIKEEERNSLEKQLIPGLVARNYKIKVIKRECIFVDIGTEESLEHAMMILKNIN